MDGEDDGLDAPEGMRWLPAGEAAQALGVGERTIRRRVVDGGVRSRRVRGRAFVLVPVADDWRAEPAKGDRAALLRRLEALEQTAASLGARLESLEAARAGPGEHGRRLERLEWLVERLLRRVEALQRVRARAGVAVAPGGAGGSAAEGTGRPARSTEGGAAP